MGNPLTVDYAPGTQIPLALFQGVPLNVIVGTASGSVDATDVSYTPADPLDWPIPPPTTVQTALDLLANVNGSYADNPSPIAATTSSIAATLVALQPQKSGIYLAWCAAQMDGTGTVAGVATASIAVDSVVQGQPVGVGYAPGTWVALASNLILVAVNRALPHTWQVILNSNTAALFAVQGQRAKLMLLEL